MARLPRLALDGLPHLIVQRGTHAQAIFADDVDRALLLSVLVDAARTHRVSAHAFALLPDAFYLLLTPQQGAALPPFMQALGRAYVRRFNLRHARRGTLWEGRYRSTLVQPGQRELEVMLTLDALAAQASASTDRADDTHHPDGVRAADAGARVMGPDRAGGSSPMIVQPLVSAGDVRWQSSRAHYVGQVSQPWLVTPAVVWALGNTPFAREAAYAALLNTGLSADAQQQMARALQGGWVLGDDAFLRQVQSLTPRRVQPGKPGRPRKAVTAHAEPVKPSDSEAGIKLCRQVGLPRCA